MQNKPLVSVLMTAYNREKYIAEAIESVIASTYQNWELIIVDDRSKDKTVDIAKSYEKKDERIKVYINKKNLGDYPNRNKAASYAKGKYLKYVDADDLIYHHTIEYMVNKFEKFPTAGWATFSVKQEIERPHPFLLTPQEQYFGHYLKNLGYFDRSPLSVMIKRDVFEKMNGFINTRMIGDFEMWNRLGQKYDLLVLPHSHGFVWYRIHEAQETSITNNKYSNKYREVAIKSLKDSNCPLKEVDRNKALVNMKKRRIKLIIINILKLKFSNIK